MQGKEPINETREVIKTILRIFEQNDWVRLAEVKTLSQGALASLLAQKDSNSPKAKIYRQILEVFGAYISQIVLIVNSKAVPNTLGELSSLRDEFRTVWSQAKDQKERLVGDLLSYAPKNALNRESVNKLKTLVDNAWFNVNQFFYAKIGAIDAAVLFVKDQARRNPSTQALARQTMAAAAPAESNEQVLASINAMTNANWEKVRMEQIKTLVMSGKPVPAEMLKPWVSQSGKGRRSRKVNKRRRNATRKQ